MKNLKELRTWLVGTKIEKVAYDSELRVLSLHLDDETVLIISTETFGKGVK